MHPTLKHMICAIPALTATVACLAEQAQVAVAANFAEPIKTIAVVLENTTGHKLKVTLGSTGKLYAQIKNTAHRLTCCWGPTAPSPPLWKKRAWLKPKAASLTPLANWCCGQQTLSLIHI